MCSLAVVRTRSAGRTSSSERGRRSRSFSSCRIGGARMSDGAFDGPVANLDELSIWWSLSEQGRGVHKRGRKLDVQIGRAASRRRVTVAEQSGQGERKEGKDVERG